MDIKTNMIETEKHLKTVNLLDLINRQKEFRLLNFKDMSYEELLCSINKVLLHNGRFRYIVNLGEYPPNTIFYRVRKLKGSIVPDDNMKTYNDFWEPPQHCVTSLGRLNKVGESLLYVVPYDYKIALQETHVKKDEFFALIKYVSKGPIKVNIIGGNYDYSNLGLTNLDAITVHEMYNNFLRDEFSRDVGVGTEYLYKISECIAKSYFDLPGRVVQDAWAYSSIQDKNRYNVCFRPEIAHDLLELKGALICKTNNLDDLNIACVAIGDLETNSVQYYRFNTYFHNSLFPEFIMNN